MSSHEVVGIPIEQIWGNFVDLRDAVVRNARILDFRSNPEPPLSDEERLAWVAAGAGCPTNTAVMKDYWRKGQEGREKIIDRENRVNALTKVILNRVRDRNPGLYRQFSRLQPRENDEPVPEDGFENESVPEYHRELISWAATPGGYGTTRVLILILDTDVKRLDPKNPSAGVKSIGPEDPTAKAVWALDALDRCIDRATTWAELLACLAEEAFTLGVVADPIEILEHVLEYQKFKEEGNKKMYIEVINKLKDKKHTPRLWEWVEKKRRDKPPLGWAQGAFLLLQMLDPVTE